MAADKNRPRYWGPIEKIHKQGEGKEFRWPEAAEAEVTATTISNEHPPLLPNNGSIHLAPQGMKGGGSPLHHQDFNYTM